VVEDVCGDYIWICLSAFCANHRDLECAIAIPYPLVCVSYIQKAL